MLREGKPSAYWSSGLLELGPTIYHPNGARTECTYLPDGGRLEVTYEDGQIKTKAVRFDPDGAHV